MTSRQGPKPTSSPKYKQRPDPLPPAPHCNRRNPNSANGMVVDTSSNNTNGRKYRKMRCVHLGPPRCCRCEAPVTEARYSKYGRSTDPSYDCPEYRQNLPNPYIELARTVHEELKKKKEYSSTLAQQSGHPKEPDGGRGTAPSETQGAEDGKPNAGPDTGEGSSVDPREKVGKGEEDQEDDEDEDEEGMPQAVRSNEPHQEPETCLDMLKAVHFSRMEDACRTVQPPKLLKHLQDSGYFYYNYDYHTRSTTDNYHLKQGNKKGVERLYHLLASF